MSLDAIRQFASRTLDEWRTIRLADLQYWHRGEGQLAIISVFALIVLLLIVRSALVRHESRGLHFSRDFPNTLPVSLPTVLARPAHSRA
jgi:aspartate oxidase